MRFCGYGNLCRPWVSTILIVGTRFCGNIVTRCVFVRVGHVKELVELRVWKAREAKFVSMRDQADRDGRFVCSLWPSASVDFSNTGSLLITMLSDRNM